MDFSVSLKGCQEVPRPGGFSELWFAYDTIVNIPDDNANLALNAAMLELGVVLKLSENIHITGIEVRPAEEA